MTLKKCCWACSRDIRLKKESVIGTIWFAYSRSCMPEPACPAGKGKWQTGAYTVLKQIAYTLIVSPFLTLRCIIKEMLSTTKLPKSQSTEISACMLLGKDSSLQNCSLQNWFIVFWVKRKKKIPQVMHNTNTKHTVSV